MGKKIKQLGITFEKAKERLLKIPTVNLIYRTLEGSGNHEVGLMAAGVSYYSFLSIFPFILGLIAIFGFFLPSVDLQASTLKFVGDNVPGATEFLQQNITNVIKLRGPLGIISILLFFWGASSMFTAVSRAINRAWNIRKPPHFFIRKGRELGMVFGIGLLFMFSLLISAVISSLFNLQAAELLIVNIGSRLLAFVLILMVFLFLYKFIPNTKTYWSCTWQGALTAALFFEGARSLFVLYLEHYANYQLIYGSIASIIILLVWIYYSAFIVILGAEFTFQYTTLHHPATAGSIENE